MKIPLTDQIQEAELHRDALQKAAADKPALMPRLHRSEALLLTVSAYASLGSAQNNGNAADQLISTLRQVDGEYGRFEIGATAAMAEVRAALRQLDRHHETWGNRT